MVVCHPVALLAPNPWLVDAAGASVACRSASLRASGHVQVPPETPPQDEAQRAPQIGILS